MITNTKIKKIEKEVDRMFDELDAKHGEYCINPVTGGGFAWGLDDIAEQKMAAVRALVAREQFANSYPGLPPLPLSDMEIDDYRNAGGLKAMIGFFARSLEMRGFDMQAHPSFHDFACGLMASITGSWNIERDPQLQRRFPPRPLRGIAPGAWYWLPAKEYANFIASYAQKVQLRSVAA